MRVRGERTWGDRERGLWGERIGEERQMTMWMGEQVGKETNDL